MPVEVTFDQFKTEWLQSVTNSWERRSLENRATAILITTAPKSANGQGNPPMKRSLAEPGVVTVVCHSLSQ